MSFPAVVWVGDRFFACMVLRHSVGPLEPAVRLALWHRVFDRFFPWVCARCHMTASMHSLMPERCREAKWSAQEERSVSLGMVQRDWPRNLTLNYFSGAVRFVSAGDDRVLSETLYWRKARGGTASGRSRDRN
jgi:hypothetical protein